MYKHTSNLCTHIIYLILKTALCHCCSVAQWYSTPCDPVEYSMPDIPGSSVGKESTCSAGSITGWGSYPAEGIPLQYVWASLVAQLVKNPPANPWLENSMDRGAWQATFHGITKSQTWLSDFLQLYEADVVLSSFYEWVIKLQRSDEPNTVQLLSEETQIRRWVVWVQILDI